MLDSLFFFLYLIYKETTSVCQLPYGRDQYPRVLLFLREISAGTIQERVLNETSKIGVKIKILREISAGTIEERVLFKSRY